MKHAHRLVRRVLRGCFSRCSAPEAFPGMPESTRRTIEADIPAWGRLVKAAGIEPE